MLNQVYVDLIFAICIASSLPFSTCFSDNIINAKYHGQSEARALWIEKDFDCNNIGSFQHQVKTDIFQECQSSYPNNQKSVEACKVGAVGVMKEREASCHQKYCNISGNLIAGPVTAIICHYIHPPWSVFISDTCIEVAISSCIGKAIPKLEEKIDRLECNDVHYVADVLNDVRHLCDSLVRAFSYNT